MRKKERRGKSRRREFKERRPNWADGFCLLFDDLCKMVDGKL